MVPKLKKYLILFIVFVCLGAAAWTYGALWYVYSKGERAGYVQKFSKRGYLIKTYEGELAMVNLPGAMPELFEFTVRDAKVADQISASSGNRVVISYEQHIGLPGNLFGDTPYFVTEVRPVLDAAAPPPLPATNK